jgi:hypothetical protein
MVGVVRGYEVFECGRWRRKIIVGAIRGWELCGFGIEDIENKQCYGSCLIDSRLGLIRTLFLLLQIMENIVKIVI